MGILTKTLLKLLKQNMINLLFGNAKLYIALVSMAILAGYFYLRLDSTKAKLEKSQSDLALALKVNENNQEKLKELNQIHKTAPFVP